MRKETTTIPKNGVSSPAASPEAATSPRGKSTLDSGDTNYTITCLAGTNSRATVKDSMDEEVFRSSSTDVATVADDTSSESSYMSLPTSVSSEAETTRSESIYYDDIGSLLGTKDNVDPADSGSTDRNATSPNAAPLAITCTIISKSLSNESSDSKNSISNSNSLLPRDEPEASAKDLYHKVIFVQVLHSVALQFQCF